MQEEDRDPIVAPEDSPRENRRRLRTGRIIIGFLIGLGIVAFLLYAMILVTTTTQPPPTP